MPSRIGSIGKNLKKPSTNRIKMLFKLTGARRVFVFLMLIVVMNIMQWGVVSRIFPDFFRFLTIVLLSFTASLYVYLKVGDRIERRKVVEEDKRWVNKSYMTMKDWMESNPY